LRRWFERQPQRVQDRLRRLVREGQFEVATGGLVQPDEALASHQGVLDQLEEGRAWLASTFGYTPRVAWLVDSFGHSDLTPQLYKRMGYSGVVLNRVHHRVKQRFRQGQHLEFLWQGQRPWAVDAVKAPAGGGGDRALSLTEGIFAHVLPVHYAAPDGYDFERSGESPPPTPR
jgi:hypothetical protein